MERNDAGKGGIPMVELSLLDGQGEVLDRVRSAEAAALTAVRAYQPGDQLVIVTDQQELYVSVDAFVTPAYIHVPQAASPMFFPPRMQNCSHTHRRLFAASCIRTLLRLPFAVVESTATWH